MCVCVFVCLCVVCCVFSVSSCVGTDKDSSLSAEIERQQPSDSPDKKLSSTHDIELDVQGDQNISCSLPEPVAVTPSTVDELEEAQSKSQEAVLSANVTSNF